MSDQSKKTFTNIIVTGKSGAGKQPRIDILIDEYHLQQLSTGDIFRKYMKIFQTYNYTGSLESFFDVKKEQFIPNSEIKAKIGTDDPEIILGLKATYFVDHGLFGPDTIVNELVYAILKKRDFSNQIFDGYPRTLSQATYLLNTLQKHKSSIDVIVYVETSDERIISRTINRRICPTCKRVYHLTFKPAKNGRCEACDAHVIQRSDDTKEKIQNRLEQFRKKTLPAIKYLEEHGIPIVRIPGHLEHFTKDAVRKSVLTALENIPNNGEGEV